MEVKVLWITDDDSDCDEDEDEDDLAGSGDSGDEEIRMIKDDDDHAAPMDEDDDEKHPCAASPDTVIAEYFAL